MFLHLLARRLRRRPSFWLVLVFVVGTFTAVTGEEFLRSAEPVTVYPLEDLTDEVNEARE